MTTEMKRLTFAVTPEIEEDLDDVKRTLYNANQSEMLRFLLQLGIMAWRRENKNSPTAATDGERQ